MRHILIYDSLLTDLSVLRLPPSCFVKFTILHRDEINDENHNQHLLNMMVELYFTVSPKV